MMHLTLDWLALRFLDFLPQGRERRKVIKLLRSLDISRGSGAAVPAPFNIYVILPVNPRKKELRQVIPAEDKQDTRNIADRDVHNKQ